MLEFAELGGAHHAEATGQILYLETGHTAGQPVVERIGRAAVHAGLAGPIARTDHHVVTLGQLVQQARNAGRIVLSVGIHEYDHLALGRARTPLDRRTVTH